MSPTIRRLPLLLGVLLGPALCPMLPSQTPARTWTDSSGRSVLAEYGGLQDGQVLLKLGNGQTVPYPLERLSAEDQAFVRQIGKPGGAAVAARVPVEKRTWPSSVEVPARSVEIAAVSENAAERRYVYRSESFEFSSQAKLAGSVMKEVARTFEATKSLVTALPWGVVCQPPEGQPRFQAALFETRTDYLAAGGPENSGGVYSSADHVFKIPFPSLGLVKRGQTYFKNDGYSNDTLVHEITHQMMDAYLPFLPLWIIEGTAEYTQMLPYKAGVFRTDAHKSAFKDTFEAWQRRAAVPAIDDLQAHLRMTRPQWEQAASSPEQMAQLYHRSLLLVYYFCHLDGDGKGTRFLRYLEAVHGEVAALQAFFADPRVKREADGRFSYPTSLTPPDLDPATAPFKHLPLLIDERSGEKLALEVIEGFKSIGVKVSVR